MTSKSRTKFLIFLIFSAVAIPASMVMLSLLAQFVAAFQQGADPASIFRGHRVIVPEETQARWIPGTVLDTVARGEREEIISTYWLAWEALSRAYQTGDTSDLVTYWAGSAYEQVMQGMQSNPPNQLFHSWHQLDLIFISDDASVVVLTDHDFLLQQDWQGTTITLSATAEITLTLDNGFWRIRNINLQYQ
jgi:hypothetical protein